MKMYVYHIFLIKYCLVVSILAEYLYTIPISVRDRDISSSMRCLASTFGLHTEGSLRTVE
jgi:hypothetical protein